MELDNLKGVGPKTSKLLNDLNILSLEDLVTYFPFRYQIYNLININDVHDDSHVTIKAIIESDPKLVFIKRNLNQISFRILSDNKLINVVIFNRNFLKNSLHIGREIILYGKYDFKKNKFIASDIKFDKINGILIEPIYHLIKGISSKELNRLINNAISYEIDTTDYIPETLIEKYNFISKNDAIVNIHNPRDINILKKAKLRVIYEEFFIFLFKIAYLRKELIVETGITRNVDRVLIDKFISSLPFELTVDQLAAVNDIFNDLNSFKRSNRIILGDVGSGKTIVSIIAMYVNYLSGYQSALMAPTEILARQHYFAIQKLTNIFGLTTELLVGSMTKREKESIVNRLMNGEIDIIVGTHALISDNVAFKNLGLVVTDEQHRFGVNQRSNLNNKGILPDVLYMSATPIPRTYAHVLYGDMDVSLIKTKLSGRKDIITEVKDETNLKDVLFKMLEEIKLGHQVYVVAPIIEEGETELHDVSKLNEKLDEAFNHKITIEVLHGKVKNNIKDAIMNDFKNNKINILVSTTVIEVGIDVPNATMIVIFDADRFGLATLHQLRGRVGRNDLQSYCYLICNKDTPRLKVLEESNDGFYISEKDFELRGEGDLFGEKQSGDMTFKMADIRRDFKIMEQAKKDIDEIFKNKELPTNLVNLVKEMNFID